MNLYEIARRRMDSQHVWDPLDDPDDVVRALGAMQAQEFHYALWSVAQRTRDISELAMRRAFDEGKILRTHILRPTWHFVAASDIEWMVALSGPRVDALNASRYRQLELGDKLLARTNKVLAKALSGGRHQTRKELAVALGRAGIQTEGQRLAYIVMRAELNGVVCSGPMHGKQHTYALLEERAPKNKKKMDRDGALAELARRYFTSHGPATVKDFSRWSSFTITDCRNGLEAIESELRSETVDGRTFWFSELPPESKPKPGIVDLVQIYDELVMGYSESRDALRSPGADLEVTAPLWHAVLLDGRAIGHWRHVIGKDEVVVEASFYKAVGGTARKAVGKAVERYGRYVDKAARLSVSSMSPPVTRTS